ncbi:MAG TPA: hypothetical protein VMS65_10255 [Polyangiaceae bacterium]|nr:hypothetical protein [Polyangiaceae bacterium]
MQKRHVFGALGLAVAGALVFLLWRCGGSSEPPAREPPTSGEASAAERAAGSDPAVTGPSSARGDDAHAPGRDAGSSPESLAAAPSASGSISPPSSAATRVNAALQNDPRDLALFARIERELKRDPPPSVNQMTALRARGATRDELLAEARRLFADDFQLRALVVRWVDEVAPPPGSATKTAPAPSGARSGAPIVQPIRAKK